MAQERCQMTFTFSSLLFAFVVPVIYDTPSDFQERMGQIRKPLFLYFGRANLPSIFCILASSTARGSKILSGMISHFAVSEVCISVYNIRDGPALLPSEKHRRTKERKQRNKSREHQSGKISTVRTGVFGQSNLPAMTELVIFARKQMCIFRFQDSI